MDRAPKKLTVSLSQRGLGTAPVLLLAAGQQTTRRFYEYFTANIRNWNTRVAYLNERQQQLIEAIAASDQIITSDYISRFAEKLGPRQARRDLEKLQDMGFLTRVGAGRGTVFTRTIQNID